MKVLNEGVPLNTKFFSVNNELLVKIFKKKKLHIKETEAIRIGADINKKKLVLLPLEYQCHSHY